LFQILKHKVNVALSVSISFFVGIDIDFLEVGVNNVAAELFEPEQQLEEVFLH